MRGKLRLSICMGMIVALFFLFPCSRGFCTQTPEDVLKQGIEEYRLENYEESVETLTKARKLLPDSSMAAFMLGMAYKQTMDYQSALLNFQDAVTLEPRIKEALPELINIHYRLGDLEEAKRWIDVAEREEIMPAPVSFLKGLVLQKEGNYLESVDAFERAKSLDEKMSQSADFQIGVSYMMARRLQEARERFQAAIVADPATDLGTYARRYQDLVEDRIFRERPWRFTAGLFGRFDSNVVAKPEESSFAGGITNEASLAFAPSFRVDFVPVLEGNKLFSANYSFGSVILNKNSTTHNLLGNTFSVTPGYRFGRSALNLNVSYGHYLLGGRRYLETFSVGPLYRYLLNERNILEVFAGFVSNDYLKPLAPGVSSIEYDQDNEGVRAYLSWVWLFARDSFFNARYEFTTENADGVRYDNKGHRFTLNTIFPIAKNVKLQASVGYFLRDFSHRLTYAEPNPAPPPLFVGVDMERKDHQYSASAGLTWEATRQLNVIFQYSATRNRSNDPLNEYTRHIFTTGIEYKF